MAGMPVGPLSLNDEVAIDLALKIVKATKAQVGDGGRRPGAGEAARRDGREARAGSAARTARASTTIPRTGRSASGRASRTCSATQLDPDTLDVAGAEAAPSRHAGARGGAHRRGGRHHRSARGRCRLDPRLRLRALHRRRALATSTSWARRPSWRCASACRRSTASASPRRRSCATWRRAGGTFYGRAEARKAA